VQTLEASFVDVLRCLELRLKTWRTMPSRSMTGDAAGQRPSVAGTLAFADCCRRCR
jgi:hypothetical protein